MNENSRDVDGWVVFYIDVGQLPPAKAEAFVERMKDSMKDVRLPSNFDAVWIPRRNQPTYVEVVKFNLDENLEVDIEEFKEQVEKIKGE